MGIALDGARNNGFKGIGTSLSWSHTVGAVANGLLTVSCTFGKAGGTTITAVDWDDGGANTQLSNTVNGVAAKETDSSGDVGTYFWYLKVPVAGTLNIKVTAAVSCELTGGSESLSGVDQTTPFNAASPQVVQRAANVNPTLTATTTSGEWVIDSVVLNGGGVTGTAGASQTKIFQEDNGAGTSEGFGSDEAAVASTTVMDWTGFTASGGATGQLVVSIRPDAGDTSLRVNLKRLGSATRPRSFAPGIAR